MKHFSTFRSWLGVNKNIFLCLIGVILTTFIIYLPSINNGWFRLGLDDRFSLWGDITLINHDWLKLIFNFNLWSFAWFSRLLTGIVTYLFSTSPEIIHFTALCVHVVTLFSFYFFLIELRKYFPILTEKISEKQKNFWAFTTIFMVVISPINVEGLCFGSASIPATTCALFSCLSLIYFMKNKRIQSLLLLIVACGSKQNAIAVPLVMMIFEISKNTHSESTIKNKIMLFIKTNTSFFIVSIVYGVVAIIARNSYDDTVVLANNLSGNMGQFEFSLSFFERFLYFSHALLIYLIKPFIPVWQTPEYSFTETLSTTTKASGFIVILFLALLYKMRKNYSMPFLLSFIAIMSPVLIIPFLRLGNYYAAERYLCDLPILFLYTIATTLIYSSLQNGFSKKAYSYIGICIPYICIMTYMTLNYSKTWQTEKMAEYLMKLNPEEQSIKYIYANVLLTGDNKDTVRALEKLNSAIELSDNDLEKQAFLELRSKTLYYHRDTISAKKDCNVLITTYNSEKGYKLLVKILLEEGTVSSNTAALSLIEKSLSMYPDPEFERLKTTLSTNVKQNFVVNLFEKATTAYQNNDLLNAKALLRKVITIDSTNAHYLAVFANCLYEQSKTREQTEEALLYIKTAIQLNTNDSMSGQYDMLKKAIVEKITLQSNIALN